MGDVTLSEVINQPYENCTFSAGFTDDDVDTMYLRLERGEDVTMIMLRPDEMAAIAFCASGALWSDCIGRFKEGKHEAGKV